MTILNQTQIDYLSEIRLMQLATARDNRPWLCNVWYVMDKDHNVYWISRDTRRHSQEITDNPYAACTFHQSFTQGLGEKGRALVISGRVEILSGENCREAYQIYGEQYPKLYDVQSIEETISGEAGHLFYKLIPEEVVWWDEVEPKENPRQTLLSK